MSMVDLNEGSRPMGAMEVDKKRDYYPSLYIIKDVGLTEEDVGSTMKVEAVIKVVSVTKRSEAGDEKSSCQLDVQKIDFMKNKEAEDFTRGRVKKRIKKERGG